MKNNTTIWIILITLTVFAFLLGYFKILNNTFIFLLLVTTFLKGHLIIDYFMNLSKIRLRYRILPTLWMGIVLGIIGVAYYFPAL